MGNYLSLDTDGGKRKNTLAGSVVGTSDTQTLTNKTLDDYTNKIHADAIHFRVKNTNGTTIYRGQPVKVTGYNVGEGAIEVVLANQATGVSNGLVEDVSIVNGGFGNVTAVGIVKDFDTTAWNEGNILYVDGVGALTNTEPTTGYAQPIAYVLRKNANNGAVQVNADYPKQDASDVRFTPYGNLSSTNVQNALKELDDEKASVTNLITSNYTYNVTDEATLDAAIAYLSGKRLYGITYTIDILNDVTVTGSKVINHPDGEYITIQGQTPTTRTFSSVVSTSGSAGNYSITYALTDATGLATNDYLAFYDATGTGSYAMHEGMWKISAVSGNNVTVTNKCRAAAFPTNTLTAITIKGKMTKMTGGNLQIQGAGATLKNLVVGGVTGNGHAVSSGKAKYNGIFASVDNTIYGIIQSATGTATVDSGSVLMSCGNTNVGITINQAYGSFGGVVASKIIASGNGNTGFANDFGASNRIGRLVACGNTQYGITTKNGANSIFDSYAICTDNVAGNFLPSPWQTNITRSVIAPAGATVTPFTLTYSASISWDIVQTNAQVTLTGNTTITPAIAHVGICTIKIIQDGTGGWSTSWGANVKFSAGTPPTLTTTANKYSVLTFFSDGTNLSLISFQTNL